MQEIYELAERLETDANPERLKWDTAQVMRDYVLARGDALSYWERGHIDAAIKLLPSTWIGFALSHLQMAMMRWEHYKPPEASRIAYLDSQTPATLLERIDALIASKSGRASNRPMIDGHLSPTMEGNT